MYQIQTVQQTETQSDTEKEVFTYSIMTLGQLLTAFILTIFFVAYFVFQKQINFFMFNDIHDEKETVFLIIAAAFVLTIIWLTSSSEVFDVIVGENRIITKVPNKNLGNYGKT